VAKDQLIASVTVANGQLAVDIAAKDESITRLVSEKKAVDADRGAEVIGQLLR
jgi:hypothetical protein